MEPSKQLDYSKQGGAAPKYSYFKTVPQSGSQSVTVTTAGGQQSVFEIPIGVYNFARSYLNFTLTVPAETNRSYLYVANLCMFAQLQVFTRTGKFLVDLSDLNNFTDVVNRCLISHEELESLDCGSGVDSSTNNYTGQPLGTLQGMKPNNFYAAAVTGTSPGNFSYRPDASNSDRFYIEPAYIETYGTSNVPVQYAFKIPLKMIKHSLLALDKDFPVTEIINMKLVWAPSTKIYFTNSANALSPTGANAAVGSVAITNLALQLAREENRLIYDSLMEQARKGMSILTDWVISNRVSGSGTSHNVSVKLNRAQGQRLKRIYHTLFNGTESGATAYDRSTKRTGITALPIKMQSYYTTFNSRREQDQNISVIECDDWQYHRDLLKGSVMFSSDIYKYNWLHISDYCDSGKPLVEQEKEQNAVRGVDMNNDIEWSIQGTAATGTWINATYVVTQREIVISPQTGIDII